MGAAAAAAAGRDDGRRTDDSTIWVGKLGLEFSLFESISFLRANCLD